MPSQLRGLIVDDSKLVQDVLSAILESDGNIKIAGTADNGLEAIEKARALRPDFVTMDITMPVMNGLEAIGHIMEKNPLPIIVITDSKDAKVAFEALSRGALEIIPKSDAQPEQAEQLIRKIKLLARVKVIRHIRNQSETRAKATDSIAVESGRDFEKAVAIASSTGGPKALAEILSALPADYPFPILIAQHIDKGFVSSLVEWMRNVCPLNVKVGENDEKIIAGTVYISPADKHMEANKAGRITLAENGPGDIYHPSCDRLLSSVGSVFGENSIGVVLTGMGNDGAKGIKIVKKNGGFAIAQDEESSVVFGMPQEAIKTGCVDAVLPLRDIARHLVQLARREAGF